MGNLRTAILLCLSAGLISAASLSAIAEPAKTSLCRQDAMIVFDASGSMSGMLRTGVRESRITRVRQALQEVLPQIEIYRNLGLIVYGSGQADSCSSIDIRFTPAPNSAARIIAEVDALVPSGGTPLTRAVQLAADVLKFREREGTIVLFTDGEETCGGATCSLARRLRLESRGLKVHVIDYTIRDPFGQRGHFKSHCLVNETGGIYVPVETKEELVAAFRKTLGCSLVTLLSPDGTTSDSVKR